MVWRSTSFSSVFLKSFYLILLFNFIVEYFQDPSSHMNLGAMLHLAGKLNGAEEEYLTAWKLSTSTIGNDKATSNSNENELIASRNTIKVNLKRLHNIMRGKGLPIIKTTGIDN